MTDVENKQTITFNEFQAWLTGLIRGMNGQLPGVEEWKQIKTMMDKVVTEKEYVEKPIPNGPIPRQPWQPWQWPQDRWPYYEIWCSGKTEPESSGQYLKTHSSNVTHTIGLSNNDDDENTAKGSLDPQLSLELDNMIEINKGL